ncbi:NADH-quinone oxidoreductase subunit K [Aureimonas populi]|uniref:NADH-quinone oxidoreductase subunit K n=1 Tax=Aureimonas populi TaxID=1701758 RepID=A0ABW5CTD2_9HYPH|nr:NADH-quinone oxidoreductase subunit K [Aureimonas populi]
MIAVSVGVLVAAGSYLMMSGRLLPYLFGLVLLSNAGNLAIFGSGRLTYARPPLVPEGAQALELANALPQALILTAIVIGFGLMSYTLALSLRSWQETGTTRMDEMRLAEPEERG